MITNSILRRGLYLAAALAFSACPSDTKCKTNADCTTGQVCNVGTGVCGTSSTGGGGGSNSGGGTATGGGTSTGGGTATGGGSNTGGGMGTGGGTTEDGGTGGGTASSGDTCADPVTLAAGSTAGDTTDDTNDYELPCTGYRNPGNDRVYKVTVPAGQRLSAAVTPVDIMADDAGAQYDPSIYIVGTPATNCLTPDVDGGLAIDVCLGGSDIDSPEITTDTAVFDNSGTTPVDVFVIVDSYFDGSAMRIRPAGGAYTLDVSFGPPPGGETCDTATPLVVGTPLTAQTLDGYQANYAETDTCALYDSSIAPMPGDRAYTVTVPAGQILQVDLTVTGGGDLDSTLNLAADVGSCGNACLAAADDGVEGDDETLIWRNSTANAASVLVIVGRYSGTGAFTLSATTRAPQPGEGCADAVALSSSLSNQSLVDYSNDYESGLGCGSGTLSNDRAYQVTVPPGQRGAVTVTPLAGADGGVSFSPSLALVAGAATACEVDPRVCTTGVVAATRARTASVINTTDAGLPVYAIVDTSGTAGNFDISFATTAVATDDTCATSTTSIVAGTPLATNLDGFYFDYAVGGGCASNPGGVDRVYKISAGAGQRVDLTATPTVTDGGMDMLLNVYDSVANCDGTTRACVAAVNGVGKGTPEKVTLVNTGTAAKDYFVSAADYDQGISGSSAFTFTATTAAIPAGEVCETAEAITASGALMNLDLSPLSRQYAVGSTCATYTGADRVFSVSLAAAQVLTVNLATTTATQDLVLNLITGTAASCNASPIVCAAKADVGNPGQPETLTYTNATTAAVTVFIVVSGYAPASNVGTFSLTTMIQ